MADSTNFNFDALVKRREDLDRMMIGNPEMEKRVQKLVRQVIIAARRAVSEDARGEMRSDPRQTYKAVKSAIYKRILGGSISILNRKKTSGGASSYEPPRKLRPNQRGGNRVPRGSNTQRIMGYSGADRGFILRFLNAGTSDRVAGTRGGRLTGNRGRIAARNFFGRTSQQAMERAAQQLENLIDQLIQNEFN